MSATKLLSIELLSYESQNGFLEIFSVFFILEEANQDIFSVVPPPLLEHTRFSTLKNYRMTTNKTFFKLIPLNNLCSIL